jgi:glycosyltransferase involved in cell wall biosynthesis
MGKVEGLIGPSEPVVFTLAQLANGGRRILRDGRYDTMALVGAPPDDEIGYGFGVFVALLGWPKDVARIDLRDGLVRRQSLLRYVAGAAPFAVGQIAASAAALAAQRLMLPAVRKASGQPTTASKLATLVYLRPAVGSGSPIGGSVTHSHEVIRALRAEGVDVRAYTNDAVIAETAKNDPEPPCHWRVVPTRRAVKAIPASAAAGTDLALVRAALRDARTADAIYQRHARFSLAGALLARVTGKPLFLEYNGPESFMGRHWNATPLQGRLAACENAALAAASRIFVVSDVDRRSLVERGVEPDRIVLNPNGVDTTRFDLGGGSEVRSRHGLESEFVVGFLGTFGPWHGAPALAQAFVDAAPSLPRAHLLLIGDGPELETTLDILRNAGLDTRATATGPVSPGEIPAYLDACDLLVAPHVPLAGGVDFFGSPTKLFEYMAAGKAIIASRLGQIADVLEHGVTGWLVEPGDVGALTEAMLALADAPALRTELGAQARRQAVERHSWRLNARAVVDAYSGLAHGSSV